jgi:hypothetical protein
VRELSATKKERADHEIMAVYHEVKQLKIEK